MFDRFMKDLNSANKMAVSDNLDVLDLSKRRDSVETRKTPSPYNTASSPDTNSPKASPDQLFALHQSNILSGSSSGAHPSLLYPHPTYYNHPSNNTSEEILALRRIQSLPMFPTNGTFPASHFDIIKTAAAMQRQTMNGISMSPHSPTLPSCESKVDVEETIDVGTPPNLRPSVLYPVVMKNDGKVARPFKAFPRDPIAMAATFTATDALLDVEKAEKYRAFRKRMLDQMYEANGGKPTVRNPKMRRGQAIKEEQANDSCSSSDDHNLTNSDGPENNNGENSSVISQNGLVKDAAYYERRKKNNAAAKKSRDRRRIKEDEIAVRAAFLEHENIELRIEIAAMKNQLALLGASVSR
ncbi:protein giant-like [Hermetia illucens]|uniref:protein giant-like n=1 Tax=Hermetia illucens TaxID=343691 RepID=UPI0018CBF3A8|nr:protein giant-like [Hermetia illucens]